MPSPAETSRRLKAARWLAGDTDKKGRPKQLKIAELAQREPLPENGISKNRLEEIEQMKITAPPMELEKIAVALDVPIEWFSTEKRGVQELMESIARRLGIVEDDPAEELIRALEADDPPNEQEDVGNGPSAP